MALLTDLIQKIKLGGQQIADSAIQGVGSAAEFVRKNPVTSAATVGGGILAGGTIIQIAKSRSKKSSTSKKKSKSASKKSKPKRRSTSKKRKQKQPYTAGKGKDTSTRRIRYTKNNQPYIILKSGKARFIKKSSVRQSRKRKGGKY